ncbi:MAG: PEP/pyruvate-binding domain-containing protein [Pseudomonadota bacterium]|nr:PEP/pyruvate-binding domain-containing protein [Pseudomonadota bacterium]
MARSDSYALPLDTNNDSLELIGGKGKSLARMANAGFSVPTGFHLTTEAYKRFVDRNGLQSKILELAKPEISGIALSFEQASNNIRDLFDQGEVSDDIVAEMTTAYTALDGNDPAVAIRSSANAEDLPELSFAGQQETYLNISGNEALVAAVRNCWASLWTAQAISYRHQNGIKQDSVAMAVVVQVMVPSDVSGILFTANPATGERSEMIVNASFGLGEAVVSGQVTPDTYIVDRETNALKETVIGPKAQKIVSDGAQGTRFEDVADDERSQSSLSETMIQELAVAAHAIESLYDGLPQDIEWAFVNGNLNLLQSRPITNLPVQPIEVEWSPTPPAKYVSRRQIVENMPDPVCPLFEELYLTEGLESTRQGKSLMVGGGPMFVTVNGYAYMRFDFPQLHESGTALEKPKPPSEKEIEAAEQKAMEAIRKRLAEEENVAKLEKNDLALFVSELPEADRIAFETWAADQPAEDLAHRVTMPESDNPTYVAFHKTAVNDRQLDEWHEVTRPRLASIGEKWSKLNPATATDEKLLEGIREMGIEEGYYWSSNSSHTFGVAKSTDDHLQCFLRETLPDHHFISGQFLSGIESKSMQANADLFEIAKSVRSNDELSKLVIITPTKFLMEALRGRNDTRQVLDAIEDYLATYGHQGYSMDFIEPTQVEDPSALFASLKAMVQDKDYDPKNQELRASAVRTNKYDEISSLLEGLEYWQFRYRLWLARKYNYIREEVAFMFGYTWSVLRPMAHELGRRLAEVGTLDQFDDVYFLVTEELNSGIEARRSNEGLPQLASLAVERRQLREARKQHHPPGTLPAEASKIRGIAFKETQIKNDDSSDTMRGFPVSSGQVTAKASVVTGADEFDKMVPGSILVSPLTTPAWTQLFAHAVGLVTDMGSILAHGSIVAREYGIPAVLGVGNGTKRIQHGQTITIDGDAGTVVIHDDADTHSS